MDATDGGAPAAGAERRPAAEQAAGDGGGVIAATSAATAAASAAAAAAARAAVQGAPAIAIVPVASVVEGFEGMELPFTEVGALASPFHFMLLLSQKSRSATRLKAHRCLLCCVA